MKQIKPLKKILVGSCLLATGSAFSFWPMIKRIDSNCFKLHAFPPENGIDQTSLYNNYVYDDHTFTRMNINSGFASDGEAEITKHLIPFLKGEFEYNEEYWQTLEQISSHQYAKIYGVIPKNPNRFFNENNNLTPNPFEPLSEKTSNRFNRFPILFKKSLESKSGVKIENMTPVDGPAYVKLSRGNKEIDLTIALRKYFDDSLSYDSLSHYVCTTKGEYVSSTAEPIFNQMNHPCLSLVDLERLRNSQILAVWGLVPQKVEIIDLNTKEEKGTRVVERQIVGLAKDAKGNLFHWVTDLGKDISVLMQYASKISQNNATSKTIDSSTR